MKMPVRSLGLVVVMNISEHARVPLQCTGHLFLVSDGLSCHAAGLIDDDADGLIIHTDGGFFVVLLVLSCFQLYLFLFG